MKKRVFTEKQLKTMNDILKKSVNDLHFHCSAGNIKVPYMNFGSAAIIGCPAAAKNNCECCSFCYAKNIENTRIKYFAGNFENMVLFSRDPARFMKEVDTAIKVYTLKCQLENKKAIVRLNESGDFYNKKYTRAMYETVKNNPDTVFYGYTKQWLNPDYDFISEFPFCKLDNCNIMFSTADNIPIPEKYAGLYKVAYTANLKHGYDIIETGRAIHCHGNCEKCNVCVTGAADVVFIIHGSKGVDLIPEKENIINATGTGLKYTLPRYVNKNNPAFYKTAATTFQGIRDIYCKKVLNINDYETRTKALYYVYKLYRAGKIEIYKNGFTISN